MRSEPSRGGAGRLGSRARAAARGAVAALGAALLAIPAAAQPPSPAPLSPRAERGKQVAERACASCHAIRLYGESPSGMAPPFRTLRMRYNPIRMERHVGDLAASGYFGMPPQPISKGDAADVAAYIETLHAP